MLSTSPPFRWRDVAPVYHLQHGAGASERIFELLDTTPEILDAPDASPMPPIKGEITFENAAFAYEEARTIIHPLNLHITVRRNYRTCWSVRGGKTDSDESYSPVFTTLQRAVFVLMVLISAPLPSKSLRAQIGLVPQDIHLFGSTIPRKYSGTVGWTQAIQKLRRQPRSANCATDFIMATPEGIRHANRREGSKIEWRTNGSGLP